MIATVYAPWFGPLPFYASTFLNCCGKADKIQWVIHSDQAAPTAPKNVLWVQINNVQQRIEKILPFAKALDWRHKLCDVKPFWPDIFKEPIAQTEYIGWIDWDVVHDLSELVFIGDAFKFTRGSMSSPLFICKADKWLHMSPRNFPVVLSYQGTAAWDELEYLPRIRAIFMQDGMTPEVDLIEKAPYAVHMYRAKHCELLYYSWVEKYFYVNRD